MPGIKILPQNIANKIAAGEVVDRPASVLKELIENSIDAGADNIIIEIQGCGEKLIKITDNGCGMTKEDLDLCIYRYATSKISSIEDIDSVSTLGFRGEALSSIASVSQLHIISKTSASNIAYFLDIEGGSVKDKGISASVTGTTIEMRNLFFNIPARRKFLKSPSVEMLHIYNVFNQLTISHPDIHFKFIHNTKQIYNLPAVNNLIERLRVLYSSDLVEKLIPLDNKNNLMEITGFISNPINSKANKLYQFLYLNNRPITNKSLSYAVFKAYGEMLERNRYPVFFINLTINPEQVDVNIHPQKKEVKFQNEKIIYDLVFNAVKEALKNADITIYAAGFKENSDNNSSDNIIREKNIKNAIGKFLQRKDKTFLFTDSSLKKNNDLVAESSPSYHSFSDKSEKGFFQIQNTYIVTSNSEGLIIIDQHAAHERIMYEKLMHNIEANKVETQYLLFPVPIEVTDRQKNLINEYMDVLTGFGFEIEEFGNHTIIIRTVPVLLKDSNLKVVFNNIMDELEDIGSESQTTVVRERLAAVSACRASIMAGDKLNIEQMESLFQAITSANFAYACPHGRPTIIKMSISDIAKNFKRNPTKKLIDF